MRHVMWIVAIVAAAGLAAHGAAVPLCLQAGGEAGFLAGMEKVRSAMDHGRWGQAEKQIRELLEEHAGQDYVRAKRVVLEECVRECAFRSGFDTPKDNQLVSGTLKSYNERTGQIKLAYACDQLGDFHGSKIKSKDSGKAEAAVRALPSAPQVHPAVFTGPFTVTIKGSRYPSVNEASRALVFVGLGSEEWHAVGFGCKAVTMGSMIERVRPFVLRFDGSRWSQVETKEASPVDPGEPFDLKVQVGASRVSATYNGKQVIKASRSGESYGQFGVLGMPFDAIEVEGKVESAWIQGLRDAAAQEARAAFEETFACAEHLPEWLYAAAPPPAAAPEPDKRAPAAADAGRRKYPGTASEEHDFVTRQALALLEKTRLTSGIEYVEKLDPAEVAEEVRLYLKALFLSALEEKSEAFECCRRVCELDPSFYDARRLHAALHAELRMRDKAIELYGALLEEFPDEQEAYVEQIRLLLRSGRLPDAKQVIDAALRRGIGGEDVEALNRQLTKAMEGPRWPRKFEHESKHYRVYSDIDKKTCFEAAQFLEDSYVAYTVFLQWTRGLDTDKFPVYIFSGKAGFMDYCEDVIGSSASWAAGLYSPPLRQLLIWNLPDSASMMRTVRHEGFHQYLDRLMDDPPLWFNEGLAEYYEIAERSGGDWNFGVAHTENLRVLAQTRGEWIPLAEFIRHSREQFYEKTTLSYAQSWAFIHFLRHESRDTRLIFEKLFESLQREPGNEAALDKAFEAVDLDELQDAFENHVAALL